MNLGEKQVIGGVLTIEVRDAEGRLVEQRRVENLITRAGRKLMANLLMGLGEISERKTYRIVVGIGGKTADKAPKPGDTQLENQVDAGEATTIEVKVTPNDDSVRTTVSATLPSLTHDITQALSEAGIEIGYSVGANVTTRTLLNRVTFADVNRGPGMTLKLSWEISF